MASLADLVERTRFELFESDYAGLWTDDYLRARLNEGQRTFCKDTGFFVDRSTFTVPVVASEVDYALDTRIIRVLEARVSGASSPLVCLDYSEYVTASADTSLEANVVQAWTTEAEMDTFTVFPTPTEDVTVQLRVWRYPLDEMDSTHDSEIPSQFDEALVHWACYKALMKHDAEISDPVKAQNHLAIYRSYVLEAKNYVMHRMRTAPALGVNPSYVW